MSSYIGNFTMCGPVVLVNIVIGPRQASQRLNGPALRWPRPKSVAAFPEEPLLNSPIAT